MPYSKMNHQEARVILQDGLYGVLATAGVDGRPYGVPLAYVVEGNCLYFHGSPYGQKIKNLRENPHVSFTVVAEAVVEPEHYTLAYRSIIAFGEVAPVHNLAAKRAAIRSLCEKYGAAFDADKLDPRLKTTAVYCMNIEYLAGKANG